METQKIYPTEDRVLVKIPKVETATASGILIPETVSKERPIQGVVEAVGPGRYDPMEIKVGDIVLFSKYGQDEVCFGEDTYYILKEENILAVIK